MVLLLTIEIVFFAIQLCPETASKFIFQILFFYLSTLSSICLNSEAIIEKKVKHGGRVQFKDGDSNLSAYSESTDNIIPIWRERMGVEPTGDIAAPQRI